MATDQDNVVTAVVVFGPFALDIRQRCLRRNSEIIRLSAKPFDLLVFLVRNHEKVVSKEDLLKNVWGEDRGLNVVEQTVGQVRKALKTDSDDPPYIVTVTGAGYQFVAPLSFPPQEVNLPPRDHLESLGRTVKRATTRRSPFLFLALVSVGLAAIGITLYATAPGEPAACGVSVNTLIVKDGQGREVWKRQFPESLSRERYDAEGSFCKYVDLDGDGTADVVFSLKRQEYLFKGDTLYGFITRSRMLRKLRPTPAQTLTFQPGADLVVGLNSDGTIAKPDEGYLRPYTIGGIFTRNNVNSGAQIVVSSVTNYAPNQIAVLDGDFKKTSEYWHTGHVKYGQFANYNGHDRLFLGGVNNGYRSATLIVFDPNNIHGTTDLTMRMPDWRPDFAVYAGGSRGHLTPFGPGTETCRVLFERTCVAKVNPYRQPYNRIIGFTVKEDRVSLTVAEGEREDTPENVVYEMDRHLNLIEAYANTKFQQRHLQLEREGLLDHAFSSEELKPLIHVLPGCEFTN